MQLNTFDSSINFSQNLINSLEENNIVFNSHFYSIRSILTTRLRFSEKNRIMIRQQESKESEMQTQRGKIYASFIRQDALDITLNGINDFFLGLISF